MATIDADGALTAKTMTGPFGEQLPNQPDTWNTLNGGTFGYGGKYQKLSEKDFATRPVQMGARVYIPGLGRFLQVDPIQGGTPNNYVYPPEPVNGNDYSGQFWTVLLRLLGPVLFKEGGKQVVKETAKQAVKQEVKQVVKNEVKQVARQEAKKNIPSGTQSGVYQFGESGRQYIGKSVNIPNRIDQHILTGKYTGGPINITQMPGASNIQLRVAEQIRINQCGGICGGELSNKINSIRPSAWDDLGIPGL